MLRIINSNNYDVNEKLLRKVSKCVASVLKQKDKKMYAILEFVDKHKIQELNQEYRENDKTTDVISFRMIDGGMQNKINQKTYPLDYDRAEKKVFIGEIFICYDMALVQSEQLEHSLEREIAFLTAHGLLHLLGLDHETEFERAVMNDLEERIMQRMRIIK